MNWSLYTRQGCHLCDEAKELLESYGVEPLVVDIDTRPELLTEYTNCVPVVLLDGKVRFRGRIDPRLLKRLMD